MVSKLINEGHFFRNCQFGYIPTYTGPGHHSIFTGTTRCRFMELLRDWYDKSSGEYIYCVGDNKMNIIGFLKKTLKVRKMERCLHTTWLPQHLEMIKKFLMMKVKL